MENNDNRKEFSDSFYFLSILFKYKYFIITVVVLATIVAVIISLLLPNEYKATAVAVPPKSQGSLMESAMGSISSALQDFGLAKLGGKSEGYSFMVILQSRSITDSIIREFNLAKRYEIPDSMMDDVRATFYANLDVSLEKTGEYTISVWDKDPKTAAKMANRVVELANKKAMNLFRSEATINREYVSERLAKTDSILNNVSAQLAEYSKEKKVISPMDQAQAITGALSELKAKVIENEVMYQLLKSRYGEEDPYTKFQKKMLQEYRQQLSQIQTKPGFGGSFSLDNAAEVGLKYMKLYTEFETYSKVKAFLLPTLEQARIDEHRFTKNLFFLDKAIPPEKKDRPKRSVYVAGTFVGSLVAAIFIAFLINGIKTFRKHYKEYNEQDNG